ncbi:hypothetical protein [Nocardioides coralli]|uniref:hypothetical protein n=1 Tax=Nocardioides coralli TaxID=2872154 RepID=UPI001CA3B5E6|nr:hypothetical protein [Nocardioides coralli]QZY28721.1 hypothetical protein K6T13_14840 [Nocardioides coralli]
MTTLPTRASLGVLLLALTAGCGGDTPGAYDARADSSVYDHAAADDSFDLDFRHQFEEQATLSDGRKVRLWFARSGDRLLEQHYSPDEQAWTEPQVVFVSDESHPCQGIDIVEENGIVAAIADFGLWCHEGEPPMQSLAAVSTGDLTEWDVDVVEGFDGWTSLTMDDEQVRWTGHGRSLSWTSDGGFGEGESPAG